MQEVIAIFYTTLYREGGPQFKQAALTLAHEKSQEFKQHTILCEAVESKEELKKRIEKVSQSQKRIKEFHFLGHSGMYGPMFGTVKWPEQLSPYEWREMKIPFSDSAKAFFHCCRSARWFAPFFARTHQVPTYGYHWYTTVSLNPLRFKWEKYDKTRNAPLYIIGCPGKKSHGLLASVKKFLGKMPAEKMKEFLPQPTQGGETYQACAELYDKVFTDIGVRFDEWKWLENKFEEIHQPRVLDIGCGNGALLTKLAKKIQSGVGVDLSEAMIALARKRQKSYSHFWFERVGGPVLPFQDNTFDVVTSLLSFRYLDWDPILKEILRVLRPGGRLFVIDMVTAPVKLKEWPFFLRCKFKSYLQHKKHKAFHKKLNQLVEHPHWKKMLQYNPIRSEHEMKWYLESRFKGHTVEIINIGWHNRVLAFDSGPIDSDVKFQNMAYP